MFLAVSACQVSEDAPTMEVAHADESFTSSVAFPGGLDKLNIRTFYLKPSIDVVDQMLTRVKGLPQAIGDESGNVVMELTKPTVVVGRSGGRGSVKKVVDVMDMFGVRGARADYIEKNEDDDEKPEDSVDPKVVKKKAREAKSMKALAKHLLT